MLDESARKRHLPLNKSPDPLNGSEGKFPGAQGLQDLRDSSLCPKTHFTSGMFLPPIQVATGKPLSKRYYSSFNRTPFLKTLCWVKTSPSIVRPDLAKLSACDQTALASWVCDLWVCMGLCTQKDAMLLLMLSCHSPEILNFWTRGPTFLFCAGLYRSCTQCCSPIFQPSKNRSLVCWL